MRPLRARGVLPPSPRQLTKNQKGKRRANHNATRLFALPRSSRRRTLPAAGKQTRAGGSHTGGIETRAAAVRADDAAVERIKGKNDGRRVREQDAGGIGRTSQENAKADLQTGETNQGIGNKSGHSGGIQVTNEENER